MFRRRRNAAEDQPATGRLDAASDDEDEFAGPGEDEYSGEDEYADEDEYSGAAGYSQRDAGLPSEQVSGSGPWDASSGYPQRERVDLGSLLIPVLPGVEVQLNVAEDQIVAVTIARGDSALQVQALAAPKTGRLWDDIRSDNAAEIAGLGGQTAEAEGPFGTELLARMPAEPGSGLTGLQPARFIGVDGPRWMLRGVLKGQAAASPEFAGPLEEVFADIVVVRGDHPAPPRDLLEIRLPPDLRQAMEQEMARAEEEAQAEQRRQYPSPFERGPEITETR